MKKKVLVVLGVLAVFGMGYLSGQGSFAQANKAPDYLPPTSTPQNYDPSEDLLLEETRASTAAMAQSMGRTESNGKKLASATHNIAKAYLAGANNKSFTQGILTHSTHEWVVGQEQAKSAAQISQVADQARMKLEFLQVAQNQKIIELLTQLNAKK
jgi:hypothetical protein